MKSITERTTIGELRRMPEYQEVADYLLLSDMEPQEVLEKKTIQDIGKGQTETFIEGLEHLNNVIKRNSNIAFDIWSDIDKKKDPTKKRTKLLFLPGLPDNPYVVVCPGGAYMAVCSLIEGFPVANILNQLGYNVFILNYRVTTCPLIPKPQEDLAQALRFIHDHCKKFRVPPEDYAVCGFSSGGHLAASWGSDNLGYRTYNLPAPGALFLGYPALSAYMFSMEDKVGKTYIKTMIGEDINNKEKLDFVSIEKHVNSFFPPTYIIHAKDDDTVTFHTSELFVKELIKRNIPYRFEGISKGGHGFSTGAGLEAEDWIKRAIIFWEKQRAKKY